MTTIKTRFIEEQILEICNYLSKKWAPLFDAKNMYIEPFSIYRNNSEDRYFSEIELNLWKSGSLEYFYSIIIFMDGKQILNVEDVEKVVNDEFEICYGEIS